MVGNPHGDSRLLTHQRHQGRAHRRWFACVVVSIDVVESRGRDRGGEGCGVNRPEGSTDLVTLTEVRYE